MYLTYSIWIQLPVEHMQAEASESCQKHASPVPLRFWEM